MALPTHSTKRGDRPEGKKVCKLTDETQSLGRALNSQSELRCSIIIVHRAVKHGGLVVCASAFLGVDDSSPEDELPLT